MRHLRFTEFVRSPACAHFAAPVLGQTGAPELHDHNFMELFWIEGGRGWHWINGRKRSLSAGTLCFIRAADQHGFSCAAGEPLKMVNVAFARQIWAHLRQRYRLADFFNGQPALPKELHLAAAQLSQIRSAAADLANGRVDQQGIDLFLLNLLRALERPSTPATANRATAPHWLIALMEKLSSTSAKDLPADTRALADWAGRSPEHLARTMRKYLARTPTEALNEARLTYAAERLVNGDDAILEIALDCGFGNLSHFYKCFAARFGTTPRKYRVGQQRILAPQGLS